jgi:hypothetical protein
MRRILWNSSEKNGTSRRSRIGNITALFRAKLKEPEHRGTDATDWTSLRAGPLLPNLGIDRRARPAAM